jgi:hypothetical protein
MESRILTARPEAGLQTLMHKDVDGRVILERKTEVTDLLEYLKARRNSLDERARWRGDGAQNLVGAIPMSEWSDMREQCTDQYGKCDKARFVVMCNNWLSANPFFKARHWNRL